MEKEQTQSKMLKRWMTALLCAGLMIACASCVQADVSLGAFSGQQSEGTAETLTASRKEEHKASETKSKKKKKKNNNSQGNNNNNNKTQGSSASGNKDSANKDSAKETEKLSSNEINDKPERESDEIKVEEDKDYTSKDEVAAYLNEFGHLPDNYISKNEAKDLGWINSKGNLDDVAPGKSIGGDYFGNYEEKLPVKKGRKYYECDIDFEGGRRNAKRIIYSNDGLVFYTEDHYETFEQLYPKGDEK